MQPEMLLEPASPTDRRSWIVERMERGQQHGAGREVIQRSLQDMSDPAFPPPDAHKRTWR